MAVERKWGARTLALLGAVAMLASACGTEETTETTDDPSATEETSEATEGAEEPSETEDGDASATETEGDEAAPAAEGDLVWAHEQEPPDMHLDDPNNNLSITSWIRQSLWEGLYGITADTQFFPELLAEEMEVVENDDGTITFNGTLREGLTWSDGTALTAQQIVDTFNIIMEGYDYEAAADDDPATEPGGTYLIGTRQGYDQIDPESIEATSETEFTYTMNEFFAGYKELFESVFPTHVVADAAAANEAFPEFMADGEPLPSTGPMLWDEWNRGSFMHLTRNDDYHGSVSPDVSNTGVANVAGVQINWVADTDAQINALQAGEADMIFTQPQLAFEESLANSEEFTVASEPGPVFEHWGLNLYDTHLQKPEVREAMALAMNKAEVMEGLYTPLFGDVLPQEGLGNTYWLSNQPEYEDHAGNAGYGRGDVEGAIAALESAGYADSGDGIYAHPDDGRLTLRVGTTGGNALRELQQQILQQQFATAGIEIEIDNVPGADYFSEQPFSPEALACANSGGQDGESIGEGDEAVVADCDVWDITQFAWVGGPWPGSISASYTTGSGNNPYGFANEEFDAAVVECDGTIDDAERAACYNTLDTYVTTLEQDPEQGLFMLPLTQKPSFYSYSNQTLSSAAVAPDADSAGPLVNVVDFQLAE